MTRVHNLHSVLPQPLIFSSLFLLLLYPHAYFYVHIYYWLGFSYRREQAVYSFWDCTQPQLIFISHHIFILFSLELSSIHICM